MALDEKEARELEGKYHISSKQFTEDGMKVKIISGQKPELPCYLPEITLEDAYMYVMK